MSSPAITVDQVSVRFQLAGGGHVDALKGVSLEIGSGEVFGIVGESGSGKSTLARVLAGLQVPDVGLLAIDGQIVNGKGRGSNRWPSEIRRAVQMVFQDPYSSLNPQLSPMSAVAEAVRVSQKIGRRASFERAAALLREVGISETRAAALPTTLSGGQRQRVSLARALAAEPAILLADEPTSAIDQSTQARILNTLLRLSTERGLTLVLISHDLSVISYATQRIAVMRSGRIVESGETASVLRSPQHEYTRRLVAAVPGRRSREERESENAIRGDC